MKLGPLESADLACIAALALIGWGMWELAGRAAAAVALGTIALLLIVLYGWRNRGRSD